MSQPESAPEVTLSLTPGQRNGVEVLKVSGPLTIRNFFEFQQTVRERTANVLILDFSEVPYIDSAALGALVGIHVSCDRNRRKYAVVGLNSRVRTVLEVSHVNQVLITYPAVGDAEAALA